VEAWPSSVADERQDSQSPSGIDAATTASIIAPSELLYLPSTVSIHAEITIFRRFLQLQLQVRGF